MLTYNWVKYVKDKQNRVTQSQNNFTLNYLIYCVKTLTVNSIILVDLKYCGFPKIEDLFCGCLNSLIPVYLHGQHLNLK